MIFFCTGSVGDTTFIYLLLKKFFCTKNVGNTVKTFLENVTTFVATFIKRNIFISILSIVNTNVSTRQLLEQKLPSRPPRRNLLNKEIFFCKI